MQAYVKTKNDWEDFVSGKHITVHRHPVPEAYKKINVARIEVEGKNEKTMWIRKKY